MASGLNSDHAGNRTDALYFGGIGVAEQAGSWPLVAPPGTAFRYANNDTVLAIRGLQHVLGDGDKALRFPFEAVLWKIGMTRTVPETDWRGHFIMSSQVWTTARDLARLGLLYLNDGMWDGQRLLPADWRSYVARHGPAQPPERVRLWRKLVDIPEGQRPAAGRDRRARQSRPICRRHPVATPGHRAARVRRQCDEFRPRRVHARRARHAQLKDTPVKRRTFLAAAPLAAIGLPFARMASAQSIGAAPPLNPALPATQYFPDVHAGDRPVGASFATRSEVFGSNGAAATSHPLGTLVGIEILKKGGSAVDAAIAINAALGFLEPTANGIGGDLYAMLWDPAAARVVGISGSGKSPRGLGLDTVRARAKDGVLPAYGAVTVTVPGTVDAWWQLHQRYGKLRWAELFEPAIAYAEGGVPLSPVVAYYMNRAMANFAAPGRGIEEVANAQATYAVGSARAGGRDLPQSRPRPHLSPDRAGRPRRVLRRRHRAHDRRPISSASAAG